MLGDSEVSCHHYYRICMICHVLTKIRGKHIQHVSGWHYPACDSTSGFEDVFFFLSGDLDKAR